MEDVVSLDVLDNGVGFDPATVETRCFGKTDSGFGLRGMRERAADLGGTLLRVTVPDRSADLAIEGGAEG